MEVPELEQVRDPRYHLRVFAALSVAERTVFSQGTVARNHSDAPGADSGLATHASACNGENWR